MKLPWYQQKRTHEFLVVVVIIISLIFVFGFAGSQVSNLKTDVYTLCINNTNQICTKIPVCQSVVYID